IPRAARSLQVQQRGDLLTIPSPDGNHTCGHDRPPIGLVISGGLVYEISPKLSATSDGMDSDG
ncbi:unnamed protein product, partial [Musa hybrid cultivar]